MRQLATALKSHAGILLLIMVATFDVIMMLNLDDKKPLTQRSTELPAYVSVGLPAGLFFVPMFCIAMTAGQLRFNRGK